MPAGGPQVVVALPLEGPGRTAEGRREAAVGRAAATEGSDGGGMRIATSGAELGVGGTVPEGDAAGVAGSVSLLVRSRVMSCTFRPYVERP